MATRRISVTDPVLIDIQKGILEIKEIVLDLQARSKAPESAPPAPKEPLSDAAPPAPVPPPVVATPTEIPRSELS